MWWRFPYTNFHELNLDWILKKVKENSDEVSSIPELVNKEIEDKIIDGEIVVKNETGLENKKILVVGDSISDPNYKSDITPWISFFSAIIEKIPGASLTNLSKAGRNLIDGSNIINGIEKNYYDIVIIFLGINDYFDSTPIGLYTSSDTGNFSGACNALLSNLQKNCETCDVYVISPLKTKAMNTPTVSLLTYIKRLYSLCLEGGYHFIDAYGNAPILCLNNQSIINKYYDEGYDNRFVHPSSEYGKYFADWVYNKIKNDENDTLGFYSEILDYNKIKDQFVNDIFELDQNSYIKIGTYSIEVNILGRLLNPSSLKGLQLFWNMPSFIKPPNKFKYYKGWTNGSNPIGLTLSYNDFYLRFDDGKGYVDLTNVSARGLVFQIQDTFTSNKCTDTIIPLTYPGI